MLKIGDTVRPSQKGDIDNRYDGLWVVVALAERHGDPIVDLQKSAEDQSGQFETYWSYVTDVYRASS